LQALVQCVRSQRGHKEVKSKDLLANAAGRRLLNRFILDAGELFFPVIVAIHKRHYAALMLLSVLLDVRLNSRAREVRLAEIMSSVLPDATAAVSDGSLASYREATKAGSADALRYAFRSVVEDLRRAHWHDLARSVEGIRPRIAEAAGQLDKDLAAWDVIGRRGNRFRTGATTDFDAFRNCLHVMNRLVGGLKANGAELPSVQVVYDDPQGREAFHRLFAAMKAAGQLENLLALELPTSTEHLGLQAADFLAGAVRYAFGAAEIAPEFAESVEAILWAFFSTPPKGCIYLPNSIFRSLQAQVGDFWRRRQIQRGHLVRLIRARSGPAAAIPPTAQPERGGPSPGEALRR